MLRKSFYYSVFFLTISFFIFTNQALAQMSDLAITIFPEYPKPGEEVYVSLENHSTDLRTAHIKWSVNGKLIEEGVGLKEMVITAGEAGLDTVIDIDITTRNGQTYFDGITLRPAEVILLWQTDGSVPPFYNGKAPYIMGAEITFTAIPEFFKNGSRINPNELLYTWKRSGSTITSASGYGKTTYKTSSTSYIRNGQDISVEVSAPNETIAGKASVFVPSSATQIIFYENHPLYGITFNKALANNVIMNENEITVLASPYFFSPAENPTNPILSNWKVNGDDALGYGNKKEITLRKINNQTGSSVLSFSIKHPSATFQNAMRSLRVSIENNS